MTEYKDLCAARINSALRTRESKISAAQKAIQLASADLPSLVLEKWVLLKIQKHRVMMARQAERNKAEQATLQRQRDEIKHKHWRFRHWV
jgi:hypothetical protein